MSITIKHSAVRYKKPSGEYEGFINAVAEESTQKFVTEIEEKKNSAVNLINNSISDFFAELEELDITDMSEEIGKLKVDVTTCEQNIDYLMLNEETKMERYIIKLVKTGTTTYKLTTYEGADLTFDSLLLTLRNTSRYVVCLYGNSKLRPQYVSDTEMLFVGLDRASTTSKVLRMLVTRSYVQYLTFDLVEDSVYQTKINTIDDTLDIHGASITTLDSAVQSRATKAEFNELKARVDDHGETVAWLDSEILNKATKTEVNTLKGRVDGHDTLISALDDEMSDKITEDDCLGIVAQYLSTHMPTDTNTTYTVSITGNTLTLTGSDGSTSTATIPTGGGGGDTVTYSLSISGRVLTLTGSNGSTSTATIPADVNTTYSISGSGRTITLTGSDGSTTTATVPADNNTTYSISGSGRKITLTGSDGSSKEVTLDDANDNTTYSLAGDNTGITLTGSDSSSQTVSWSDVTSKVSGNIGNASSSKAGLMSGADKARLDTLTDAYINSLIDSKLTGVDALIGGGF